MKFIWNLDHMNLINTDKIRNFEIIPDDYGVSIVAWISDSESTHVGRFESVRDAQTYLSNHFDTKKKEGLR